MPRGSWVARAGRKGVDCATGAQIAGSLESLLEFEFNCGEKAGKNAGKKGKKRAFELVCRSSAAARSGDRWSGHPRTSGELPALAVSLGQFAAAESFTILVLVISS